ncbi:hypothetical protein JAAARDRAFT_28678 [Jaapia argillacea MUCL 33604]|uniref:F-box domain-containing protein n=1 Tax=Jaapia argillacea MUCL 33604 TaxID=933084 RepID=A0A067QFS0_9AGAM|nr:hypothetical protein JAAARDRAFT_28678 [Jaapia argillacea MUCL 33604]
MADMEADDPISQLDAQISSHAEVIEKHAAAVRALKSRRNSYAAIARLPNEILTDIFHILASQPIQISPFDPVRSPLWVVVSHVCHRWRVVALSSPTLWGHILTPFPEWVPEMLARSKQTPIVFEVDRRFPGVAALDAIRPHFARIRALKLVCPQRDLTRFFQSLSHTSAPLLESLSVESPQLGESFENLFLLDAPRLRSISLTTCLVKWDSQIFRSGNLLHLALCFVPNVRAVPTMLQMLDTLECMPRLQSLTLENIVPILQPGPQGLPPHHRQVALLHLWSLRIRTADCLTSANFINQLVIPRSSSLSLYHMIADTSMSIFNIFFSLIRPHCDPSMGGKVIRRVEVTAEDRIPLIVQGSTPEDPSPHLHVSQDHLTSAQPTPSVLCAMGEGSTFSHVDYLLLSRCADSITGWAKALMSFPATENVELFSTRSTMLARALGGIVDSHGDEWEQPALECGFEEELGLEMFIVLPKLKTVLLKEVDFGEIMHMDAMSFVDALHNTLRTRKLRGVTVGTLKIRKCANVTSGDLERLGEFVDVVEWDGLVESRPPNITVGPFGYPHITPPTGIRILSLSLSSTVALPAHSCVVVPDNTPPRTVPT